VDQAAGSGEVNDRVAQNEDQRFPAWHKEVLEGRRRLMKEGKLKFLYFNEAMTDLRREVRDNSPA
jgi:hypothetical protein